MSFVSLYEEKEQFKQQANITAILAAASLEIKKSCACFSDWNWEQWTLYIFLGIFSLSAYSVGVFLLSLFLHKRKIKIGSYFGKVKKIVRKRQHLQDQQEFHLQNFENESHVPKFIGASAPCSHTLVRSPTVSSHRMSYDAEPIYGSGTAHQNEYGFSPRLFRKGHGSIDSFQSADNSFFNREALLKDQQMNQQMNQGRQQPHFFAKLNSIPESNHARYFI
jgi:hypothetical protein